VAIRFKWGNSHNGTAGSIVNVSTIDIGVTNKVTNNGAFAEGDCLIAVVLVRDGGSDPGAVSVPDFQTITDNYAAGIRLWVGYRIAGASETGSYAASWASATTPGVGWMLLAFSGVDQASPIDVSAQQHNATSTQTHPVPSITPNLENDFWLAIEGRVGSNVPDAPSAPLTLLHDALGNSSSGRPEICAAGRQLQSTAPTGIGVFTQAAFTQVSQGISIGLTKDLSIPDVGGEGWIPSYRRRRRSGDDR